MVTGGVVDRDLERVYGALRRRVRRRKHGRVFVCVNVEEHTAITFRCDEDDMTDDDVRRLMSEVDGGHIDCQR